MCFECEYFQLGVRVIEFHKKSKQGNEITEIYTHQWGTGIIKFLFSDGTIN